MPRRIDPANVTITGNDTHRNGIAGKPFTVVLFDFNDEGKQRKMLAMLAELDEGQTSNGECYVVDLTMAASGNVVFAQNSWRGDVFEDVLRSKLEDGAVQ